MPLNQRDVKNQIITALPENEQRDAVLSESRATGGYFIITDFRVFEIYTAGGDVYVQVRNFGNDGWDSVDVTGDTELDLS